MTTPDGVLHPYDVLVEMKRRRAEKGTTRRAPATTSVPVGDAGADVVAITDPEAYVAAALDRIVAEVAGTTTGGRNAAAHKGGQSVGRIVGAGLPLDKVTACEAVLEACRVNGHVADDGEKMAADSIRSGYLWGVDHPIVWEHVPATVAPTATPFELPAGTVMPTPPAPDLDTVVAAEVARLRVGRMARRLLDAEESAALYKSAPEGYTFREFVAIEFPEVPYLITEVLPHGANATLTAPFKTGKTTLIGELVAALAGGGPFLGKFDVAGDVGGIAVWDYEMNPRQHQAWVRDLDPHVVDKDRVHLRHLRGARVKLDTDRGTAEAIEWLRSRGIGVWVIDPFARAYLGEENDNGAITLWTDLIDVIKTEAGVHTFVMPVHTGRREAEPGSERARGGTRIDDWPDVRWLLARGEDGGRYFRASGRDVEVDELGLRMLPDRRLVADMPGRKAAELEVHLSRVLSLLSPVGTGRPGVTKTAIREALSWSATTANKRLGEMVRAGRIVEMGGLYFSSAASAFDPDELA